MGVNQVLLVKIANEDTAALMEAEKDYGESWCKRGGVDSFMNIARKWDRIEHQAKTKNGFNIIEACVEDARPHGIIDDIRDLRRYLFLIEEKVRREHNIHNEQLDKNKADNNGDVDEPAGYVNQG